MQKPTLNELIDDATLALRGETQWLDTIDSRMLCYGYTQRQNPDLTPYSLESVQAQLKQIKAFNNYLDRSAVKIEGNISAIPTKDWLAEESQLIADWWQHKNHIPLRPDMALQYVDNQDSYGVPIIATHHFRQTTQYSWTYMLGLSGVSLALTFLAGDTLPTIVPMCVQLSIFFLFLSQAQTSKQYVQGLLNTTSSSISTTWSEVFSHKKPVDSLLVAMLGDMAAVYLQKPAYVGVPALLTLSPAVAFKVLTALAYDEDNTLHPDAITRLAAFTNQCACNTLPNAVIAGAG